MRQLPSGTVTFLFSDIEGSTKLLDELGAENYSEALAEHRRKLREAFTAQGGVEVDTQGDAFFVAFPTANGALGAARDAQAALAEGPIRVRIGIHSGEPLLTEEGYVGIDVHRGARVMSAGHGGQVLVSAETHALLDGSFELVELGRHRLKDLTEPQPLYQLGAGDFPPLKTLYQSNLPVQPTPLVGREAELAEVLSLLEQSRLVTLTGAGGSGKTRLALQAAAELVEEFRDGVWWVPLAALREHELVEPTIAQVVGAKDGLAEHLRAKRTLLLLDNFEQIVEAAPQLSTLFAEAPELRVLVTSRERLGIAAEQEYIVPTLARAEAIALFTARARQLKTRFEPDEHVAEICRRLDGLPLAIELAAARIKVLSAAELLERLGRSLELLTAGARDAPERHRTLRATIEWSYDLLDERERELFARLAVFAGSFDVSAAEAVCDAQIDDLAALVDKSLLRQADDSRFFMLETIREFARLLSSADEERHARYFFAGVASLTRGTITPERADRIERDEANYRAALRWMVDRGAAEDAIRMCLGLDPFWEIRDRFVEANGWFDEALALPGPVEPALRGRALAIHAMVALSAQRIADAARAIDETLRIARELGDAELHIDGLTALAMHIRMTEGDFAQGVTALEEALARSRHVGDRDRERRSLHILGELERDRGHSARAAELLESSAALSREAGDLVFTAATLHSLGDLALDQHDFERARSRYRESLEISWEVNFHSNIGYCLCGLACIALERGDPQRAGRLWAAVQRFEEERGLGLNPHERERYEKVLAELDAPAEPAELEDAVEDALRV